MHSAFYFIIFIHLYENIMYLLISDLYIFIHHFKAMKRDGGGNA